MCDIIQVSKRKVPMSHIPEGDRMQSRIMCLDDMVAKDSMVRIIDRFIDITDLEALGFQNTTPNIRGRSSYSPKTLAKLYMFCYTEGIRSSRKIEKACLTNIEVMWLTGDLRPDFKTIADFRRDNSASLAELFYEFASFADSAGLYGKKLVAIDGTKIRASNVKKRNVSKKSLKRRVEHHDKKVADYLARMDEEDDIEAREELAVKACDAQRKRDDAQDLLGYMERRGVEKVSLTDGDARSMGKGRQGMHVAYNVQTAVDAQNHLFTAFDVTNRPDDHGQLARMAALSQETMRKSGATYLADKGYWGSDDLEACRAWNIDCIVAPQAGRIKGRFALENFSYDAESDSYTCPEGAVLFCKSKPDTKQKVYSSKQACLACAAVGACKTKGLSYRKVTRRPNSEILEQAQAHYHANAELYKQRQQIVEHPFGTIKRTMNGDHFLLRGLEKVKCETALLLTGYNLKRSLNALGFDTMMAKLDEYAAVIGVSGDYLLSLPALFRYISSVRERLGWVLPALSRLCGGAAL